MTGHERCCGAVTTLAVLSETWILAPAPPLPNWGALGKLLSLSVPVMSP